MKIIRTNALDMAEYSGYIILDIQQIISDTIYYLVFLEDIPDNIFKYPQVIEL